MSDLLLLILGGRKAREAYQDHTQAIIERTAAMRALRETLREKEKKADDG